MDKKEYMNKVGLNVETLLKNGIFQQIYYEKIKKALEIAWNTRDFEISMYWKRATYYWAFITSIFVAYFHILNSVKLFGHHDLALFFVILIYHSSPGFAICILCKIYHPFLLQT